MIDRNLRNRYSRQTMFPGIGEEGQVKLSNGNAVIIGSGALGTNIATFLVRAGVGKVRIVDRDFIEYHNLQRQVEYPTIMRIINGVQVTSWDKLVELMSYKARHGDREVKLCEAPRFMLLAGG